MTPLPPTAIGCVPRWQRFAPAGLNLWGQLPGPLPVCALLPAPVRLVHQVHQVLEKLPQRATQVFLLSQLDGLTYRAISEQLNISEATVKRDMKLAFLACISLYNG